jgi:hypothetical protein
VNDNEWSLPDYGLTFNTGTPDDTGCTYLVTEDSGWRSGAGFSNNRDKRAFGHGEFRRPNYSTGLIASLEGSFWGPTPQARSAAERKLRAIGRDPHQLIRVIGSDALGDLFSDMELDGQPLVAVSQKRDGRFSFQFAAHDPRRYGSAIGGSTTLQSSSGGLDWATGGGLNWSPGLNWGTVSSTGLITFVNTGTAETDPTFTVSSPTGTLVNPVITLQDTGQRLRYNGTLNAGDTLVISTSEYSRSVLLNGSTDVRTRLDLAEWFQIPVGSHTVLFTASNVNAAAELTGSANVAYW